MARAFSLEAETPAWFRLLIWLAVLANLALILGRALSFLGAGAVWDDAYIFVRYADNLLHEDRFVWNPGGPPTYGITAPLYLVVVIPFRLLLPDNPSAALLASSFFSGVLFLALLLLLLLRFIPRRTLFSQLLILLIFTVLARVNFFGFHFISGMDTTFALAYLTLYLILLKEFERSPSLFRALGAGTVAGLAFWARPDLCLFTLAAPGSILLFRSESRFRRHTLLLLVFAFALLLLQLALSRQFFGSALPLPFYCKSLSLYGPEITARYRPIALKQFLYYVGKFWLFFFLLAFSLGRNFKAWLSGRSAAEAGLLLASILFFSYYLFFVLQIMYYCQRFYYPTLPVLVWLVVHSVYLIKEEIEKKLGALPPLSLRFPLYFFLLLVCASASHAGYVYYHFQEMREGFTWSDLNVTTKENAARLWGWFQLDEISALPDDLVLATTEVGHVGVLNPRKTIIDLSGLNEPSLARHGFEAERFFQEYQPDFIYLPHWHYGQMNRQIRNSETFQRDYHFYPRTLIRRQFGVAIRRQSKYAAELEEIVHRGLARPIRPPKRRSWNAVDEGF